MNANKGSRERLRLRVWVNGIFMDRNHFTDWLTEQEAASLLSAIDRVRATPQPRKRPATHGKYKRHPSTNPSLYTTQAPPSAWTNLHNRRLQNLGGVPDSVGGMHPVPVPGYASAVFLALVQASACVLCAFCSWALLLQPPPRALHSKSQVPHTLPSHTSITPPLAGIFEPDAPPNHVLLNDYARGQGIAPHKDGPLYQDTVAIVSLGTPARLDFWEASDPTQAAALPPRASVHLAPRSLLVFRGAAYRDFFHGILRREPSAATADPLDDRRVSLTVRRVLRVREGAERLETSEQRREEKRKEARFLMSITDDRPDLSS